MADMLFTAVTALSHDGLVRGHNEDSVVAGPWTICSPNFSKRPRAR